MSNRFEGKVAVADDFNKSSVKVAVDLNSVDTVVGKRDEHLRSPDFFDVKKAPKMTFESTGIVGTPSRRSVPGVLPVSEPSETRSITSSASWNARPIFSPNRPTTSTTSCGQPDSIAPNRADVAMSAAVLSASTDR